MRTSEMWIILWIPNENYETTLQRSAKAYVWRMHFGAGGILRFFGDSPQKHGETASKSARSDQAWTAVNVDGPN